MEILRKYSILGLVIVFLVSMYGVVFAAPREPTYGSAVVDGVIGEWSLTNDFFADMYRAGDPTKKIESKLYLRYDCVAKTMYVLVYTVNNIPALVSPTDAWAAINGVSNKVYTGNSGNDGTPPDFSWIDIGFDQDQTHARGYEASFSLAEGTYKIIAHVDVFDDSASQTSATDRKTSMVGIDVKVSCVGIQGTPCDYCVFGSDGVISDQKLWIDGDIGSNSETVILGGADTKSIEGGGTTSLGTTLKVDGNIVANGGVTIGGTSTVHGSVDTGGSVVTGVLVHVIGDITTAGTITLGDNSQVDGVITEFGAPATFTLVSCPAATSFNSGGPNVKKYNGKTTTLAPGSYGALTLGTLNKLYLSAGEYFFDSIWVGNSLDLFLDVTGGPISIFVTGDVRFGTNMDVVLTGGSPSDVRAETHGTWIMLAGSDWIGTIFAPFGNIEIDGGNNHITGALWSCQKVILDDSITVNCIPCEF